MSLQLSNKTVTAFNGPAPPKTESVATYELNASGDIKQALNNGAPSDIGDWLNPKSGMSDFECFATLNAGTLFAGTTGSWLDLSSNRSWSVKDTTVGGGAVTASLGLQIREKANHANSVNATINLSATLSA